MKSIILIFAASLLLVGLACKGNSPLSTIVPPEGAYTYSSYDPAGTQVTSGYLLIVVQDSNHVGGIWQIQKIGNAEDIGPQFGSGTLRGHFSQGKLVVGLNQNFVDNNVFLIGAFDGKTFQGAWQWVSFPGITGKGTFKAVR